MKNIEKHKDDPFVQAFARKIDPATIDQKIEHILNLTPLHHEENKMFRYHDRTYAIVPDIGCDYAMWDETVEQKKTVSFPMPTKGDYEIILSGCNQKYGKFKLCMPKKEDQGSSQHQFSIVSKNLKKTTDTFSCTSPITHSIMSKDCKWLAFASANSHNNTLFLLNLENHEQEYYFFNNPIEVIVAGHKSPLFLACNRHENDSRLTCSLWNGCMVLPHKAFNNTVHAGISPDDLTFIIYGDNRLQLYVNKSTNIDNPAMKAIHTITWKNSNIARASFTPDGKMIIIALENGTFDLLDSLVNDIKHHPMKWSINPSHTIPPLLLYSLKNQLLISHDPIPYPDSNVCTFVIRKLKNGRILSGYNFHPKSCCAMGLTKDERSIVFIENDKTVSQLNLYSDEDIQHFDFIENKANFYQLCMLWNTCKKYKTDQTKDDIINKNATKLVQSIRNHLKIMNSSTTPNNS